MRLTLYFIAITMAMLLQCTATGQEIEKTPVAAAAHKYIFTPQTVYPLSMRPRPVASGFGLRIQPDSILCSLPYFGRAYSADYYSRKNVADFISADFGYETSRKGGETTISITPRDNKDVKTLKLVFYEDSDYANVYISFNQQQAIEYRGTLKIIPIE